MTRFYVVMVTDPSPRNPYLIIEKILTVDGMRDRITNRSFETLKEADEFCKEKNGL